ncbi:MAG: transposase [Acidobacteria bacterium]|nr:transposase [Acidobacteriota bacterium]
MAKTGSKKLLPKFFEKSSAPAHTQNLLKLDNLIDDAKCFAAVRQLRWPTGVQCAWCHSD